jgi:hypothetical protein
MTTPNFAKLLDSSRDITLAEPRSHGIPMALFSAAGIATGIFILVGNVPGARLTGAAALIFGLSGLALGLQQLFGTQATLRMDPTGFELRGLGRTWRTSWDQVDYFGVLTVGWGLRSRSSVGMKMVPSARNAVVALASCLFGCDGALPSCYGLKPIVLATILNARLQAARNV